MAISSTMAYATGELYDWSKQYPLYPVITTTVPQIIERVEIRDDPALREALNTALRLLEMVLKRLEVKDDRQIQ